VYEWVAVDSLVFSTVDAEVGLPISVQIKLAQSDAATDRLLEDGGADISSVPRYFTGKAGIH
jgi:hypothetical protein